MVKLTISKTFEDIIQALHFLKFIEEEIEKGYLAGDGWELDNEYKN